MQIGTVESPAFLVFPKYGNMPADCCILAAKTKEDAIAEVQTRWGVNGYFK